VTVADVVFRFLLGGACVSVFAAVGSGFKPKSFAGLFGSAPTVALVSLTLAFADHGSLQVALLGRSMLVGALALAAYSAACIVLVCVQQIPVALGATLAWTAWGAVAAALFFGLVR
jgi:uncharacterized membrane protein (GlpM family)